MKVTQLVKRRERQEGKPNSRYIGSFRILKRIRSVAYRWSYPRVEPNPFHILEVTPVKLKKDLSFEVQPVAIVDQEMKQLRSEVISMVKVLWRSDSVEKMTWETIAFMRFWETKP